MSSTEAGNEPGSLLPTALVGAAILIAAGVFIFWPSGGNRADRQDPSESAAAASSRSGAGVGGIGERAVDPAAKQTRAASAATRRSRGLAQPDEIDPPPEPKTREEKIAAKQRQLERAEMSVAQIEAGLERYPKIRAEALEATDNVEFTTRSYDRKKENMELNLQRARAEVEAVTLELEELEAGG